MDGMDDDAVPPDPFGGLFGMPEGSEAYADTPLFRELQRVLLSSAGSPINWELARQVGIATAQQGRPDPEPSDADQRALEEAVRLAELQVGSFTGLEPPAEVGDVQAVRRAAWVEGNADGLRGLLEPAAARITEAMTRADLPDVAGSEEAPAATGQLQAVMGQIAPLMLGIQVGQVLGSLGAHVLGQYDIAVPREGSGRMFFVVPNIQAFEHDWSLPEPEFRTWVALHEVTHRYEFARPWTSEHFRHLVDDFLSTLRVDVAGLQERLGSLDPSDPTSIQEAFSGEDALFGTVLDDEQRIKLRRLQAFMAAAEGYGDHVMHGVGKSLLPAYGRLEEAMRRYRESESGDPVFERLLGVEMKREHYREGRRFCDTAAELTDEATLATMWSSAEALPSLPEIEEPRLWLARTV
jgi:putative hydrolase